MLYSSLFLVAQTWHCCMSSSSMRRGSNKLPGLLLVPSEHTFVQGCFGKSIAGLREKNYRDAVGNRANSTISVFSIGRSALVQAGRPSLPRLCRDSPQQVRV
jgi:hypothetical protein